MTDRPHYLSPLEIALTFGNSIDNDPDTFGDDDEHTDAELAELLEAAYGPLPANPGAVDWTRDDMRDERDAWDQTIPVAEFDGTPF
jgi:hypothetical protein